MSPEVNLDLEDVPFAILEVVKARILANRRRLGLSQEQTKPRPSTRPRPQFRKTGASSKGWRKPQHGAGVLGGESGFLLEPPAAYFNNGLSVLSDEYDPLIFSKFNSLSTRGPAYSDFAITNGPTAGTFGLAPQSGYNSLGYIYLSGLSEPSYLDLDKLNFELFSVLGLSFSANVPQPPHPVLALPSLANPDAAAASFDSFTVECLYRDAQSNIILDFNNFRLNFFGASGSGGKSSLRIILSGVISSSIPEGSYSPTSEIYDVLMINDASGPGTVNLPDSTEDGWRHVALCKNKDNITFYVSGQLIFVATLSLNYWDRYARLVAENPSGGDGLIYSVNIGALPIIARLSSFGIPGSSVPSIHGLRFTPESIYSGESFTPPISITDLE